ncbi:hypothetical protein [Algoriphagus taiwanensis]|uniref:PsbP C-terminal domain-containing protein n=1 Tax=Algoriphagus taiwanensis TaxID=1445656 RepID=A0ABQ6Q366_9BACT|nr:hypothetical protein Ataiwa_17140 [Algoriphagus taiwanensis]
MKKTSSFLFLFILFGIHSAFSQIKAVTENGDTIYVYNDGTWSYELRESSSQSGSMDFLNEIVEVETIDASFTTPASSKDKVKNAMDQFQIFFNSEDWRRVPPATLNDEAEFAFESKFSDVWSVVISEETPIEKETLFKIARKNMEDNTGTKPETISLTQFKVNGQDILRGVLRASFSGITFVFDTYYYSDERGSVQFTTWSSEAVWKKNEEKIQDLLKGFEVIGLE